jgi:hypothetical protein
LIDVSLGKKVWGSIEDPRRFQQLSIIGNKLLEVCKHQIEWERGGRGSGAGDGNEDGSGKNRSGHTINLFGGGYSAFIESDLIWEPATAEEILTHLNIISSSKDDNNVRFPCVIAPMIYDSPSISPRLDAWGRERKDQDKKTFYDVFAFRKRGVRFVKNWPYHYSLKDPLVQEGRESWHRGLLLMESVGSFVMGHDECFLRGKFSEELENNEAIVDFCSSLRREGCTILVDPELEVIHPLKGKWGEIDNGRKGVMIP